MRTRNYFSGTYFICDVCGKEYTFSQAFLCPLKGQEYRPFGGGLAVALHDLCRDCAGQTQKMNPVALQQLETEINAIDAVADMLFKQIGDEG